MTADWMKGLLAGVILGNLPLLVRLAVALLQRELLDLKHRQHLDAMHRMEREAALARLHTARGQPPGHPPATRLAR